MMKYELLSRCSTVPVKASNASPYQYHFLAAFHVTAPYLFEKYYPRIC